MDADEREIFQFLKTWGGQFIGAVEICRRAGGKKRFHDDPNWAKVPLTRMAERNILESDIQGRYRIKPIPRKHKQQWVAPDIAKILGESGVESSKTESDESDLAGDEYYDNL